MIRRLFERCLLSTFPRTFRDRLGRPMVQTLFADSRRPDGQLSARRLAAGSLDVARAGLAERLRRRHPARTSDAPARFGAWQLVTGLAADAIGASRVVRHRPTFALAVVATLAVGLGATTAMFAVIDAVLLRPLGYPDDRALVLMGERQASRSIVGASFPALREFAEFPEVASVGAYTSWQLLFKEAESERASGMAVSPGFFQTLGVAPMLGTVVNPGDPLLDPAPKMVLGYDLWRRQFGSDAGVIGRVVPLESRIYTIVGVMPRGFSFPAGAEFWSSMPENMNRIVNEPTLRFVDVVGRMRAGATLDDVRARMTEWASRTDRTSPASVGGDEWTPFAESLRDRVVGDVRPGLTAGFAGVCLLLVVACANAAALVLANGRSRLRDFAVQATLGASRARLARIIVFEGVWLAIAGAAAALVASAAARHWIVELSTNQIPRIGDVVVGGRVAAFAAITAVAATLFITAAPAWLLTRPAALASGAQTSRSAAGSRSGRRVFGALVAIEFALALALTAGAGLLLTSYLRLQAVDNGVSAGRVLTMRVNTPLAPGWTGEDVLRRLHDELLTQVGALPGVEHAAVAARLPMDPARGGVDMWAPERPTVKARGLTQTVSEGFVAAIGARLTAGRDFSPADRAGTPTVALVNAELAHALWPGEDAVGRVLEYQYLRGPVRATVIGVVGSIRYEDLTSELRPEAYLSFRQGRMLPQSFVVRTSQADPLALVPPIRVVLNGIDPTRSVTLDQITTLDQRIARTFARPRFFLVLFGTFGTAAFLLAALGIYGTMTFWISERWRELGIRLALGATRARVARHVVARGLSVAAVGLTAGGIATLYGSRFLSALLFGVTPTDPATLFVAVAGLAGVAIGACVLPARRISRLDPARTLRD